MTQPNGLIQIVDARCYELFKNGMSEEEISEDVGIPIIRIREAIEREVLKGKILNKKEINMNNLIKQVEQWSIDKGLDKGNSFTQYAKSSEEMGEVAAALCRNDVDELRDGIGDVIVTLIILAQQNGMTLYECLEQAYGEIKDRTGVMSEDGSFIKSEDL